MMAVSGVWVDIVCVPSFFRRFLETPDVARWTENPSLLLGWGQDCTFLSFLLNLHHGHEDDNKRAEARMGKQAIPGMSFICQQKGRRGDGKKDYSPIPPPPLRDTHHQHQNQK